MLRVIDRLAGAVRDVLRPTVDIDYEARARFERRAREIEARLLALQLEADIIARREQRRRRISRTEKPK